MKGSHSFDPAHLTSGTHAFDAVGQGRPADAAEGLKLPTSLNPESEKSIEDSQSLPKKKGVLKSLTNGLGNVAGKMGRFATRHPIAVTGAVTLVAGVGLASICLVGGGPAGFLLAGVVISAVGVGMVGADLGGWTKSDNTSQQIEQGKQTPPLQSSLGSPRMDLLPQQAPNRSSRNDHADGPLESTRTAPDRNSEEGVSSGPSKGPFGKLRSAGDKFMRRVASSVNVLSQASAKPKTAKEGPSFDEILAKMEEKPGSWEELDAELRAAAELGEEDSPASIREQSELAGGSPSSEAASKVEREIHAEETVRRHSMEERPTRAEPKAEGQGPERSKSTPPSSGVQGLHQQIKEGLNLRKVDPNALRKPSNPPGSRSMNDALSSQFDQFNKRPELSDKPMDQNQSEVDESEWD